MTPAVSVILPCYNHEAYVRAAVDSVLGQSLADIEVIAIDDASSDATYSILEAINDCRLTVWRHSINQGSAQTVNEGIRRSRAPYVAILNSDDLFHPDRLARCLEYVRGADCRLLGTDLDLINAAGEVNQDRSFWWNEWYRGLREHQRMTGDLIGTLIHGNIFISTSNFFVDRRLFKEVGYLADYRYVQDYEFLLRTISQHPGRVAWLEEKLLSYRLHGKNTILEDQVVPVRQTVEILARWMPDLAVGAQAMSRLHLFEGHLIRLFGYIENGMRTQMNAEISRLNGEVSAAHEEMARTNEQQAESAAQSERAIADLKDNQERLLAGVAAAETERNALRGELETIRLAMEQCRGELEAARRQVTAVYESRSYRIGFALLQPLRRLMALLR